MSSVYSGRAATVARSAGRPRTLPLTRRCTIAPVTVDARARDRREETVRAERSDASRAYPSPRAGGGAPRGRGGAGTERERFERERPPRGGRPTGGRAPDPRGGGRGAPRQPDEFRRPAPPAESRRAAGSSAVRHPGRPAASGLGVHGVVAVLGMFLLTLVAGAADSYIGVGLGTITLVALTVGAAAAVFLGRPRGLFSVLVAPPLVFIAVALVNIGLAPSAPLNLPTLATLLVRGFPAMAIATGVAIVLSLFRLVTKR